MTSIPKEEGTALHIATSAGNTVMVELLLDRGANPSVSSPGIGSPLHVAVKGWQLESVALLIDRVATVGARDTAGRTSRHLAARNGRLEVIRVLLGRGANLDITGSTLDLAAESGKLLLNLRADIEATFNRELATWPKSGCSSGW